jgi:hypothetical protein
MLLLFLLAFKLTIIMDVVEGGLGVIGVITL